MPTLSNWSETATSTPAEDPFVPANLDALVTFVRNLPSGRRVRPMGHRHSVNHCFEADGEFQVDMSRFGANTPPVVDPAAKTVTVAAGVTLLEVRDALRQHDLELPVSPEIGNATAGSVACAGTKDGSLRGRAPGVGQISSLVTQVRIVDAAGNPRTLTGPALAPFRSSHGLMGIVYEVTFQAVDREVLDIEYAWLDLDPLPDIARIFRRRDGRQADGVLAFIQPYERRIVVEGRTRLGPAAAPPSARDQLKRAIRDFIWEWGQNTALAKAEKIAADAGFTPALFDVFPAGPVTPDLPRPVLDALRRLVDNALDVVAATRGALPPVHKDVPKIFEAFVGALGLAAPLAVAWVPPPSGTGDGPGNFMRALVDRTAVALEVLGGYRAYRSESMIDFAHDRFPLVFDFTFWAFPQSGWTSIVPDYLEFCAKFFADTGYRPSIFTEVYFIDHDQNSWLSFSPTEPIFTLNMVDAPRKIDGRWQWDDRWFEMNRRFNLWAVERAGAGYKRRGRPILNQTKELQRTPQVLADAFGADWPRFVAEMNREDKPRRFRSAYFTALGIV